MLIKRRDLAEVTHTYSSGLKETEAGTCDSKFLGYKQNFVTHLPSFLKNEGKVNILYQLFSGNVEWRGLVDVSIYFTFLLYYSHIEDVEIVSLKSWLIRKNMLGLRKFFPLKLLVPWIIVQRAIACDVMDL